MSFVGLNVHIVLNEGQKVTGKIASVIQESNMLILQDCVVSFGDGARSTEVRFPRLELSAEQIVSVEVIGTSTSSKNSSQSSTQQSKRIVKNVSSKQSKLSNTHLNDSSEMNSKGPSMQQIKTPFESPIKQKKTWQQQQQSFGLKDAPTMKNTSKNGNYVSLIPGTNNHDELNPNHRKSADAKTWAKVDVQNIINQEFDFQANLELFDKQRIFSDIRSSDVIKPQDRLVSFNQRKIPHNQNILDDNNNYREDEIHLQKNPILIEVSGTTNQKPIDRVAQLMAAFTRQDSAIVSTKKSSSAPHSAPNQQETFFSTLDKIDSRETIENGNRKNEKIPETKPVTPKKVLKKGEKIHTRSESVTQKNEFDHFYNADFKTSDLIHQEEPFNHTMLPSSLVEEINVAKDFKNITKPTTQIKSTMGQNPNSIKNLISPTQITQSLSEVSINSCPDAKNLPSVDPSICATIEQQLFMTSMLSSDQLTENGGRSLYETIQPLLIKKRRVILIPSSDRIGAYLLACGRVLVNRGFEVFYLAPIVDSYNPAPGFFSLAVRQLRLYGGKDCSSLSLAIDSSHDLVITSLGIESEFIRKIFTHKNSGNMMLSLVCAGTVCLPGARMHVSFGLPLITKTNSVGSAYTAGKTDVNQFVLCDIGYQSDLVTSTLEKIMGLSLDYSTVFPPTSCITPYFSQ